MSKRISTAITATAAAFLLSASLVGFGSSATAAGDGSADQVNAQASYGLGCC